MAFYVSCLDERMIVREGDDCVYATFDGAPDKIGRFFVLHDCLNMVMWSSNAAMSRWSQSSRNCRWRSFSDAM
jgi:hypothetical protein